MNIGSVGGLGGGDTNVPRVEGADANDPAPGTDGKEDGRNDGIGTLDGDEMPIEGLAD
jgi:hypothetical protein